MPGMMMRRNRRQRRRRTALVVGGAAAIGSRHGRKSAEQAQQVQQDAYDEGVDDATVQQAAPQSSSDNIAEVEKLAALRDKGILTEEEFQTKKRQLLGL